MADAWAVAEGAEASRRAAWAHYYASTERAARLMAAARMLLAGAVHDAEAYGDALLTASAEARRLAWRELVAGDVPPREAERLAPCWQQGLRDAEAAYWRQRDQQPEAFLGWPVGDGLCR